MDSPLNALAFHTEQTDTVPMSEFQTLADLRERLVKVSVDLGGLADDADDTSSSYFRLCSKQQGVDLAISYLDEMTPAGASDPAADVD